jgi:hypothetical protein
MVVCDVSARNPNVMFELGLRLAFDKPTILIKDDETDYAFDTSPIEHLEYPRGLRYGTMVGFKEKLAEKMQATHKQATADKNYTTFLKHFGEFKVADVETTKVSGQEFIIAQIEEMKSYVRKLAMRDSWGPQFRPLSPRLAGVEFRFVGDNDRLGEAVQHLRHLNLPPDAEITLVPDEAVLVKMASGNYRKYGSKLSETARELGLKFETLLPNGAVVSRRDSNAS